MSVQVQRDVCDSNGLSFPLLMTSQTDDWCCRTWTLEVLATVLGDKVFPCRVGRKSCGVKMETECSHHNITVQQLVAWLNGCPKGDNPLSLYPRTENWAYIDYKYMKDMFDHKPDIWKQVNWEDFGLYGMDGYDSTMWIGSEGANTPGHQDSYGFNLVTQIQGRKMWILFPPEDSDCLYPTRIPYEESSVFLQVNVRRPDMKRHPAFKWSHPVVVTLHPGQTLYVPRHWWHYVECLDPSISLNVWVPVEEDKDSHLHEAITRCLASSLIPILDTSKDLNFQSFWLNPNESLTPADLNLGFLQTAVCQVLERDGNHSPFQNTGDNGIEEVRPVVPDSEDIEKEKRKEEKDFMKNSGQVKSRWKKDESNFENTSMKSETGFLDISQHDGANKRKRKRHSEKTDDNSLSSLDLQEEKSIAGSADRHKINFLHAFARTLEGKSICRVDTPFSLDDDIVNGSDLCTGKSMTTFKLSSGKKQKLGHHSGKDFTNSSTTSEIGDKISENISNVNNSSFDLASKHYGHVSNSTSTAVQVFQLGPCKMEAYLSFMNTLCQQMKCPVCYGEKRNLSSSSPYGVPHEHTSVSDKYTSLPHKHTSLTDMSTNISGILVQNMTSGASSNKTLEILGSQHNSVSSGSGTSLPINKRQPASHAFEEDPGDFNQSDFGDTNLEGHSSCGLSSHSPASPLTAECDNQRLEKSSSNQSVNVEKSSSSSSSSSQSNSDGNIVDSSNSYDILSSLSHVEVAESLLTCVLNPSVVEQISVLFLEEYQRKVREKN